MSDLMREEFEQAVVNMHVSHGVPPEDAAAFLEIGSNGYRSVSTKSAWWAWQASRECMVIDTRPIRIEADCHVESGVESVFYAAIDAIHAAGVKTK